MTTIEWINIIDKRIKLLFLKILHRLIFANEVLPHSGQKICFQGFNVQNCLHLS